VLKDRCNNKSGSPGRGDRTSVRMCWEARVQKNRCLFVFQEVQGGQHGGLSQGLRQCVHLSLLQRKRREAGGRVQSKKVCGERQGGRRNVVCTLWAA
jgi:hypothetical protein